MRVCLAQMKPVKGNINLNLDIHLSIIKSAVPLDVDLIIFPELSLTGFEPKLAQKLRQEPASKKFMPLQKLAEQNKLTIGIGLPTSSAKGLHISMLLFHANGERQVYSKRLLHRDEFPYFVGGDNEPNICVNGHRVGIGICYETLQKEHFTRAVNAKTEICIASVAKPEKGIFKAYAHFEHMAKNLKLPVLMANCFGHCDNFLSVGNSAAWDQNGKLLATLDDKSTGLIVYDTITQTAFAQVITAVPGQ